MSNDRVSYLIGFGYVIFGSVFVGIAANSFAVGAFLFIAIMGALEMAETRPRLRKPKSEWIFSHCPNDGEPDGCAGCPALADENGKPRADHCAAVFVRK